MKKLLLALVIISCGMMVQAQDHSLEAKATARVNKLDNKLNLTAEQKTQIHDLFVAQTKEERVDGQKVSSMSKEERTAFIQARKSQREAFEQQLATILTPEQFDKLQANKKEGKGGTKGKGKEAKRDKASIIQKKADKLTEELQLNPEQKAAVIATLEENFVAKKHKSFKEMTKEDKAAAKKAKGDTKAAIDEQFKTIFTPEQYAAYQNGKEEKKEEKMEKRATNTDAMIQKKVNQLSESLQLSTEQKAQVTSLMKEQHTARMNKGAKKDWTPENRKANKANRKGAKAAYESKMKDILTDEQYAKFQTLQEGRKEKGRKRGSLKKGKR